MEENKLNKATNAALDEILKFLKINKDPHILFPPGVESILDEKGGAWSFGLIIENTTTSDKEVALLTGNINTDRFVLIDALGQYDSIDGQAIQTPYSSGEIINVKDNPRLINKIVGDIVDCIATSEHHNGAVEPELIEQTVYKDATGEVTITSQDYFWNFFAEYLKFASLRISSIHISSSDVTQYNKRMTLRDLKPFTNTEKEYIFLEKFYSDLNSTGTKIIIDRPINLTHEKFMSLPIPAGASVTIMFMVSATHSGGNAINAKMKAANFVSSISKALTAKTDEETKSSLTSAQSLTTAK